jgi:hypothetical protein
MSAPNRTTRFLLHSFTTRWSWLYFHQIWHFLQNLTWYFFKRKLRNEYNWQRRTSYLICSENAKGRRERERVEIQRYNSWFLQCRWTSTCPLSVSNRYVMCVHQNTNDKNGSRCRINSSRILLKTGELRPAHLHIFFSYGFYRHALDRGHRNRCQCWSHSCC